MVDRQVPQQYSTLQAAANAAQPGDEISIEYSLLPSHSTGQVGLNGKDDITIRGTINGNVITKAMHKAGQARPYVTANSNALINATGCSRLIVEGLELNADWTNPSGSSAGNFGNGTISFFPSANDPALDCIIRNCKIMAGPWHVAGIQQNNGANRLTLEDLEITSSPGRPPLGAFGANGASCFSNFGPIIQGSGSAADNWLRVRRCVMHNCIQWASSYNINVANVTDGNAAIAETANGNSQFENLFEDCLMYDCGGDAFNFFRWDNTGQTRIVNCTSYRMGLTAGLTIPHPSFSGPGSGNYLGTPVAPSQPAYNGTQASFAAGFDAGNSNFVVSNCVMIRGGSGSQNVFTSLNGGSNGTLQADCNTRVGYSAWGETVGSNNTVETLTSVGIPNIASRDFHPIPTSPLVGTGCQSVNGNIANPIDQECDTWPSVGRGALTAANVEPCSVNFPANQTVCANTSWSFDLTTFGGTAPFTYVSGDGEISTVTNNAWTGTSSGAAGGSKTVTFTDGNGATCTIDFDVVTCGACPDSFTVDEFNPAVVNLCADDPNMLINTTSMINVVGSGTAADIEIQLPIITTNASVATGGVASGSPRILSINPQGVGQATLTVQWQVTKAGCPAITRQRNIIVNVTDCAGSGDTTHFIG